MRRDLSGPTIGIALRATTYTDIGWYVSPERPLHLPHGLEFDVVQTRGHDMASDLPMTHLDGWAGFTFAPAPLGLLTVDLWMNEYRSEGIVSNGVTRVAAQWIRPTRAGHWMLRAGSETRVFAGGRAGVYVVGMPQTRIGGTDALVTKALS